MSIIVSKLTGGTNSHQETAETANAVATDFVSQGPVGTITNTGGIAPATGGFAVNAQGSPDMTVAVSAGTAYVRATPDSQNSQVLRVVNSATTNATITANSSGSTKYDWVYIKIDPTKAANPAVNADDVATIVVSRSSTPTADDGTPPTYGYNLAVVTVANSASSITNANITDKRSQSFVGTTTTQLQTATGFDFVESGCVWTADAAASTRNASMTSGYVWLGGQRLSVAAVTARSFTASKDVYVDLSNNGDGTAAFTYTDNTTNAASPALTAGSLRLAIVVVGASSIATTASINQGQEDRVLPIASSIPYTVTDSLGNLICPRDPNRKLLGYRQRILDLTSATTNTAITELSVPVIIPTGRKVKLIFYAKNWRHTTATTNMTVAIWDGAIAGTEVGRLFSTAAGANYSMACSLDTQPASISSGLHTFNASFSGASATGTLEGGATYPIHLRVELI